MIMNHTINRSILEDVWLLIILNIILSLIPQLLNNTRFVDMIIWCTNPRFFCTYDLLSVHSITYNKDKVLEIIVNKMAYCTIAIIVLKRKTPAKTMNNF